MSTLDNGLDRWRGGATLVKVKGHRSKGFQIIKRAWACLTIVLCFGCSEKKSIVGVWSFESENHSKTSIEFREDGTFGYTQAMAASLGGVNISLSGKYTLRKSNEVSLEFKTVPNIAVPEPALSGAFVNGELLIQTTNINGPVVTTYKRVGHPRAPIGLF
jgi:hypothetical protein